jgi:hypothetical protein
MDFDLDCLTSSSLNSAFKAGTRYRCPNFYGSMLWAKDAELFYYPITREFPFNMDNYWGNGSHASIYVVDPTYSQLAAMKVRPEVVVYIQQIILQADLEVELDSIGDQSASAIAAGRHFSV